MRTLTKEMQQSITPEKALELLKKGNERFQSNIKINRNLLEQVNSTSDGQFPFAVILSCIDSRTSAELIFDQGLGDIFSIRIAGNILNDDIIGSMEFACKLAGSKIIVVLGHSACGAVKGACSGAKLGKLTGLLEKIQPSVAAVKKGGNILPDELVDKVAANNVNLVVKQIKEKSQILSELIDSKQVAIVGGMYSVQTGVVDFF